MSIQAITCAMALRDVTPSEKLLLLALANYADEHMRCYPSQRRLAEDTCLSDRTIRTLLAGLEGRQVLSRVERLRQDGSRSTDVITLHFSGLVTTSISGGAEIISGGVRKPLPGGAEMASALTTFEPSTEPSCEPIERAESAPRQKASKRVPETWCPSEAAHAQLISEGFTSGDLERALTRMRDHQFKTALSDWDAAFRNWVRRDADFKPRQALKAYDGHSRPQPSDAKRAAREANYARAFAAPVMAADGSWD